MPAKDALTLFLDTIEATGGVVKFPNGEYAPEGDIDWIDLGEAYIAGCNERNRVPVIRTMCASEVEG